MKVAVIGAGVCGLGAIKTCLEEGLSPECFDVKDGLGGVWNYLPTPVEGQPSVIRSTITNTCKAVYCYSDFPCPDDFPNYLHHTKVMEYMQMYAKKFDLERYIHYRTKVTEIAQTDDFKRTGQWTVKTKDVTTGMESTKIFDAVLVCNGNTSKTFTPEFEGSKDFQGQQLHSHKYRTSKDFEGKRVLVVGMGGNTSGDIAVELSHVCSQVFFSTRQGSWVVTRTLNGGVVNDYLLNRRCLNALPRCIKSRLLAYVLNSIFDQSLYGVKPNHSPDQQQPFVCDELHHLLLSNRIILKSNVRRLTTTGVEFEDGTFEENIDAIIYATGYSMDTSFVNHASYNVDDENFNDLYRFVFAADVKPHTMAIIGSIKPNNALLPIAELQCRWAVAVLKGEVFLPSEDQMKKAVKRRREQSLTRYVHCPRNTTFVECIDYMDEIGEDIGCNPDWKQRLLSDPRLAMAIFFGECIPSHYRLRGRGAWPKARETILSNWDRMIKPFQIHRRAINSRDQRSSVSWILALGLALIVIYFVICN